MRGTTAKPLPLSHHNVLCRHQTLGIGWGTSYMLYLVPFSACMVTWLLTLVATAKLRPVMCRRWPPKWVPL